MEDLIRSAVPDISRFTGLVNEEREEPAIAEEKPPYAVEDRWGFDRRNNSVKVRTLFRSTMTLQPSTVMRE